MNNKWMARLAFVSLCLGGLTSSAVDIVAHRGASFDAPENTLAAFKLGWQQNSDANELDIWLTKDGQAIIMHDATTKRTAGLDKKVSEQTLAELRGLDAGSWKSPQWKGEKIPTLAEALATIPAGKRFFLEIKCGVEVLPEMERVIKASGKKPQQLPIIAFSYEVAKQAKARFPAHEVSFLYDWKKDKDTGVKLSADELIAKAKAGKLDGLDVHFSGPIDADYVKKVKAAGLKFYVWTVDDAAVARRMVEAGVEAITTNRPQWLREQLK
jgi:glycerophosphoryl diester phosphodiesterase